MSAGELQPSGSSTPHEPPQTTAPHATSPPLFHDEQHIALEALNAAPIIVLKLDPQGIVQYVNPFFEKLTGWRLDEVKGKDWFSTCLPARDRDRIRTLFHVAVQGKPNRENINAILTRDGTELEIEWNDQVMRDADARVIGVLVLGSDVTERQRTDSELRQIAARYQRAERGTQDGLWEWNLRNDEVYHSPRWLEILGYLPGDLPEHISSFANLIHPDDRSQIWQAVDGHLKADSRFDEECRLRCKSGEYLWVRTRAVAERDAEGIPILMSGFIMDISAQKSVAMVLEFEQNRLRQILDAQFGFVCVLTLDGIIVEINQALLALMRRPRSDVLSRRFCEVGWLKPGTETQMRAAVDAAAQGETVRVDVDARFPDHGRRTVDVVISPLRDSAGLTINVIAFGVDVTERKLAEIEAIRQANRLKEAQRIGRLGFLDWNVDTNELLLSDETLVIYGLDPRRKSRHLEEVTKLLHPEDRERVVEALSNACTGIPMRDMEHRIIRPDGKLIHIRANAELFRTADSDAPHLLGTIQDITERKQAEDLLRASEARLNEAQRIARIGSWELDLTTMALTWSDEIFRIFEIDPERFVASYEGFLNAIHPEDREMVNAAYQNSLKKCQPYEVVHRLLMADGRITFVRERCETYYDAAGLPLRSVGTVQDITERVIAETALQQERDRLRHSEDRLRLALDASAAGIWSWQVNNRNVEWDDRSRLLYGFGPQDATTFEAWVDRIHPDDRAKVLEANRMLLDSTDEHSWNAEYRILHPAKGVRWMAGIGRLDRDQDGRPLRVAGITFDITERKQAEETIRQREAQFAAVFRRNQVAMGIRRLRDDVLIETNASFDRMLQCSNEELIGRRVGDLGFYVNPSQREQVVADAQRRQPIHGLEVELHNRAGSVVHVLMAVDYITLDGEECALATFTDITERKKNEDQVRELRDILVYATRIGTLNEIASGLAHELNQPLTIIHLDACTAQLICEELDSAELNDCMKRIGEQSLRAGEIIRRMRSFIRPSVSAKAREDINRLIREVLLLLSDHLLQNAVEVELHLAESLPQVVVDGIQIQQVLVNLIRNACDAMSANMDRPCVVSIRTEFTDGEIRTSVSDSGCGLAHIETKLFFPFQTTKATGLGLGLSICRTLVEAHGGRIEAFSNANCGATFIFTIPVTL